MHLSPLGGLTTVYPASRRGRAAVHPHAHPPPSRYARAGVAGGLAVGCGLAGHLIGGGTVSLPATLAALLAATALAAALAGRERGWLWLAGQQIGTQLVVHAVLAGVTAPGGRAELLPHDVTFHLHMAAGLVTATLLRAAERRVWASARRAAAAVAACLARLTGPRLPAPAPRAVPAVRAGARPRPRLGRGTAALRGPPLPA